MAVLKTAGRADIAAAYKALAQEPNNFMIGFGEGETWWGGTQQVVLTFEEDEIQLPSAHAPISGLVVRSADGSILYASGTDYLVNASTGRIERVFGGNIIEDQTVQLTYTATVPQPTLTSQALVSETGRVSVTAVHYIVPFDEAEDPGANFVIVEGAKYALVDGPSRMLLFLGHLGAADGIGGPIREYGLFSRCVVDPDLPPGQTYFEPSNIVEGGTLIVAKNRTPVPHDGTVGLDMSIILEI